MRKLTAAVAFIIYITNMAAQAPEQDCFYAIPICNTAYSTITSYSGGGNIPNEIGANACLGAGELNSVWYKLYITAPGMLAFNLCPNANDDYDWGVYNLTNHPCTDIKDSASLEVSCSFTGSTTPTSCTGPNGGPNPQDRPMIPVLNGQLYYICVTNFSSTQSGYTLDFSISTCGLDSCLAQQFVSVAEQQMPIEATLFPNPATQTVTLKLSNINPNEEYTICLYNSAGQLVKEQKKLQAQTTIDIATLPAGLYTYTVSTPKGKTAGGRFGKE